MTPHATVFRNLKAATKRAVPLPELLASIEAGDPHSASKAACPLFSTFAFGDVRSQDDCLRTTENALDACAVVAEHDAETISPELARDKLAAYGIRATLYTTASHTAATPRWRIVAPTARAIDKAEYPQMVARINGLFGGEIASESFVVAQSFYYGHVNGRDFAAYSTTGACIDELEELDAHALYPHRPAPGGEGGGDPAGATDTEHRETIRTGAPGVHAALLSLAARNVGRGMSPADSAAVLVGLLEACEWRERDRARWQERRDSIGHLVNSAAEKFGDKRGRDDAREHAESHANPSDEDSYRDEDGDAPAGLQSRLVTFDNLDASEPAPHFVDSIIPQDEVTLFGGHGGLGKSYINLLLALHIVAGRQFGRLAVKQSTVLFFSSEDGASTLRWRTRRLCEKLGIDPERLRGRLHLLDMSDADAALHREYVRHVAGEKRISFTTDTLNHLAVLVEALQPGVVFIDGASDTFDDAEIDRARVRTFIRTLRQRIARPGRAVVLLAHVNKTTAKTGATADSESYSGSTAWHNSVRSRLALTGERGGVLTLQHQKANLGPVADPIMIEFQDGVPGIVGTHGPHPAADFIRQQQREQDQRDKAALVELVRRFEARGERVTTAAQGNATVHRLLRGEPGFPADTTSDRLMRLLRELESDRRLFRVVIRTADRKHREAFRTTPCDPESAPIPEPDDAGGAAAGQREAA